MSSVSTVEKDLCTGCSTCEVVCSVVRIAMTECFVERSRALLSFLWRTARSQGGYIGKGPQDYPHRITRKVIL